MPRDLPSLYYKEGTNFHILPSWSIFFIRLGNKLATIPNTKQRVVVSIAVPTRIFAACLTATGIVQARIPRDESTDNTQLEYILGLKPGTCVYIHDSNHRKYPGVVEGFTEMFGTQRIIISTGQSEKRFLPVDEYASKITEIDRDTVRLPKYQKHGYSDEIPSEFLQLCLGEAKAQKHVLDSSFDVLIIGKKTLIAEEANANAFGIKNPVTNMYIRGSLQEILRIRQLSGTSKSYRSQCISPSNTNPKKEIGDTTPNIIIFDGAVSYIKLGHKLNSAHQVVILDRTERQFGEIINLLNQNYAYRLKGKIPLQINIPNGIEMMVYKDSIQ